VDGSLAAIKRSEILLMIVSVTELTIIDVNRLTLVLEVVNFRVSRQPNLTAIGRKLGLTSLILIARQIHYSQSRINSRSFPTVVIAGVDTVKE
jgi:hypothetical protein